MTSNSGRKQRRGAALAAVSILLAIAGCGTAGETSGSGSRGLEPVQVMMFPAQVYRLPAVIAKQRDFFAERGLQVQFIPQPPKLQGTQSLQATKSQVGQLSTITLSQGRQHGAEIAFFCGGLDAIQTSLVAASGSALPSTEDGASWQQVLKSMDGKRIGIQTPVGSGVQLLFAAALKEVGVENVSYVNIGTDLNVAKASLTNGSVDVAQVTPPVLQNMLAAGAVKHVLYLPDGPRAYARNYGSAWSAPTSWLEEKPDAAAAFCAAIKEGLDFIRDPANREQAAMALQQDTGVPPAVARQVLEDGVFADFSTSIDMDLLESTLDLYTDLGIVKENPQLDASSLVRQGER